MRVLVIEDEVYLLRILKKRLKEEGYAVDTAADGESGRDFAVSVTYDCIVLDIMLPGKDGFIILEELRAKKVKTPVLILTAKDTTNNKVRGLDLGADDYLVKPFSFDEFLARLRALLRRQSKDKVNVLSSCSSQGCHLPVLQSLSFSFGKYSNIFLMPSIAFSRSSKVCFS